PTCAGGPEEPVAIVCQPEVAMRGCHVRRKPRGCLSRREAVGHGREHHHAGDEPDLHDHRGLTTPLRVAADRDAGPFRRALNEELRPPLIRVPRVQRIEELRQPVVDAVRYADVESGLGELWYGEAPIAAIDD